VRHVFFRTDDESVWSSFSLVSDNNHDRSSNSTFEIIHSGMQPFGEIFWGLKVEDKF
jgi:hypothetical protein